MEPYREQVGKLRKEGVEIAAIYERLKERGYTGSLLDNGWAEDELAVKLGRVLELNGWRNGLESQLVGILVAAIQAVPAG